MPSRTDQMISKGKGKAKAVKATTKGLVGVFRTLMEQHGEVSALMRRVQADEDKRDELWPKIREELLSHERGELRVVYPVLREHTETRALAEQHDREANELELQIERIDTAPINSVQWGRLFDDLVELVLDHVDEEETTIFPAAQDAIGKSRARELEDEFLSAKRAVELELA